MGTENLRDDVLIFADPFDTSDHNQDGYTVGSLDFIGCGSIIACCPSASEINRG